MLFTLLADLDLSNTYIQLLLASTIIILSFFFGELSQKTNVPSVLMLIVLGVVMQYLILGAFGVELKEEDILPSLKLLGIVGLIMIVLEAALELELKKEKYIPIAKAMLIALLGLVASAWVAALFLNYFIVGMTMDKAWLYAIPLSILSSAIIIPSVSALTPAKKEFHIYESTFSDILGIMMFTYMTGELTTGESDGHGGGGGFAAFGVTVLVTIIVSLIASYLIILIFQNIRSHAKFFLLIAVLLFLYAVGVLLHLSALIVILVFGLVIANMKLFFKGPLGKWLNFEKANHIYEGLHVITMETAFVIRTFFFVAFGLSITVASIFDLNVAMVSVLIIASIYIIRFVILRLFIGEDIIPQLYIAPRGLITILLFYKLPEAAQVEGFNPGILLFVIIGTSLIMTVAMIRDKQTTGAAIRKAGSNPIGYEKWKAPTVTEVADDEGHGHGH